jgi:ribosomal protein L11 methyltransferase
MNWVRINIKTSHECEDAVSNLLMDMDAGGVQIENDDLDGIVISAYFPPDDMIGKRVFKINALLKNLEGWGLNTCGSKVLLEKVDANSWSEQWKKFFKPLCIGERLLVTPSWEDVSNFTSRDIIIYIDPGMAFGTGGHSTTALCLEMLEKVLNGGERVLDFGTGSGILSIAAVKLAASRVLAVDIDEKAVKTAGENSRRNNVDDRIQLIQGELNNSFKDKFDVIVSNISSKTIISMMPDFKSYLNPDGRLILSGILDHESPKIQKELANNGLIFLEERCDKEWVAILAHGNTV